MRQDPGGAREHHRQLGDEASRSEHRDLTLEQRGRLGPVALEEMEHARGMVGEKDRVRMMRRLGEPNRLRFVLGRFGESAQMGEGDQEPEAIVDRGRLTASKELMGPVGRHRGEVGRR